MMLQAEIQIFLKSKVQTMVVIGLIFIHIVITALLPGAQLDIK